MKAFVSIVNVVPGSPTNWMPPVTMLGIMFSADRNRLRQVVERTLNLLQNRQSAVGFGDGNRPIGSVESTVLIEFKRDVVNSTR